MLASASLTRGVVVGERGRDTRHEMIGVHASKVLGVRGVRNYRPVAADSLDAFIAGGRRRIWVVITYL